MVHPRLAIQRKTAHRKYIREEDNKKIEKFIFKKKLNKFIMRIQCNQRTMQSTDDVMEKRRPTLRLIDLRKGVADEFT